MKIMNVGFNIVVGIYATIVTVIYTLVLMLSIFIMSKHLHEWICDVLEKFPEPVFKEI